MSETTNTKDSVISIIENINHVDGFDPKPFAVDITDLNSNETRKRLPVMIQIAWFRLKYPEGKIAVSATPVNDHFVATARIYPNYKDSPDCYLSEATVSRGVIPEKPTVSAREWAQTAAIGVALRNAGFDLLYATTGAELEPNTLNEFDNLNNAERNEESYSSLPTAPVPEPELTSEQKFDQALKVTCPITKFGGKSLGEVLALDPKAIIWCATKYTGDPQVVEAAQFICDYSSMQAAG